MSAGAGRVIIRCSRCGAEKGPMRQNQLIGGWFCKKCDDFITAPSPKLEARYNNRVAKRKRKESQ